MGLDRVTSGRQVPDDFNVVIEIPMNADPVKYEVDKETGAVFVDRFMSTAMHYSQYRGIRSSRDLPESRLAAITHFFEHYKGLERGKWVKVQGWVGAAAAKKEIREGVARFKRAKKKPAF